MVSSSSSSLPSPGRLCSTAMLLLLLFLSVSLLLMRGVDSFALVSHHRPYRLQQQPLRQTSASGPLFSSIAADNADASLLALEQLSPTMRARKHQKQQQPAVQEEEEQDPASTSTTLPAGVVPHIQVIQSHIELQEFLAEDDRLCMIKFHAAWCKSCKRFGLHFNKLVSQKGDWIDSKTQELVKEGQVRVASIEWQSCTALCRSLGIKRLPTVHFYHEGEKVGGIAAGPTKFKKVQQALDHYLSLRPQELDFEAEMERGKDLMDEQLKQAPQPKKASTLSTMSSPTPAETVAANKKALVTEANATPKEEQGDDSRRASWWNVKAVLSQRRARRAAAREEQEAQP